MTMTTTPQADIDFGKATKMRRADGGNEIFRVLFSGANISPHEYYIRCDDWRDLESRWYWHNAAQDENEESKSQGEDLNLGGVISKQSIRLLEELAKFGLMGTTKEEVSVRIIDQALRCYVEPPKLMRWPSDTHNFGGDRK